MWRWIFVGFVLCLISAMADANAANKGDAEVLSDEKIVTQSDGLDSSVDIQPLQAEMSEEERSQNKDIFAADDEMPELKCEDLRLKKQVSSYIYKAISQQATSSVLENRSRVLLVRNMQDFQEIDADAISSRESFITATSLAFLKIKKQRRISRVCVSRGNKAKGFQNVYAIIYPFSGYYRVAIPNLAPNSQALEEKAMFIFNW